MFKEAIQAAKRVYENIALKNDTPEGWTLTEIEVCENGNKGSKTRKFLYLEQPLGNGEVHIYTDGHVFVGCTDLERKVFNFKTNKHKINELAQYVKNRYGH